MTTSEAPVPRTANLLACKQWWKVCFLYGDQEKYYRQIYGKAASQRIAMSGNTTPTINNNDSIANNNKLPKKFDTREMGLHRDRPDIIFPTGRKSKIPFTQPRDGDNFTMGHGLTDELKLNSRVTVLDDPFLFGLSDESMDKDSGIMTDGKLNQSVVDIIDCHQSGIDSADNSMTFHDTTDLHLSEDELKMLHLNYGRRGNFNSSTSNGILICSPSNGGSVNMLKEESNSPPPLPLRGMNSNGVRDGGGGGCDDGRRSSNSSNGSLKTSPTFGLPQNGLCAEVQNILHDG